MIKSKCADCRAVFSPDEIEKSQEYFAYFKILRQNQAENMLARCVRRYIQRFPKMPHILSSYFTNEWNGAMRKA